MTLSIDCGEGKHDVCSGSGTYHYLIPQLDGKAYDCACECHERHPCEGCGAPVGGDPEEFPYCARCLAERLHTLP